MRILGVDPGQKRHGWALVETAKRLGYVRYVRSGWGEPPQVCSEEEYRVSVVERPEFHGLSRVIHPGPLVDTAWHSGRLTSLLSAQSVRAVDWKRRLGLRPNAGDLEVGAIVRRFVEDLPRRTNVHVRDACAIALATAWERQGQC